MSTVAVVIAAGVPVLLALNYLRERRKKTLLPHHQALRCSNAAIIEREYASFDSRPGSMSNTLVVDCVHPTCPTLTHHKGGSTPSEVKDDTSGDIVLNALTTNHPILEKLEKVSCNHYDIDGLVAVWSAMHPEKALEHQAVLRQTARIGDLRELDLSQDGAMQALRICCWSNSVEAELFYRPFEGSESEGSDEKYAYFLPRLTEVLKGLKCGGSEAVKVCVEGNQEFDRVVSDLGALERDRPVSGWPRDTECGLVTIATSQPPHYYALFSQTIGSDYLLTLYPGNRYELECKYTGYVDIVSRPVMPRVDLRTLTKTLNEFESSADVKWTCSRFTDSGPMMRLDSASRKLTKAERYGNPYSRPIFESSIAPEVMSDLVASYLRHALHGVQPKNFWKWEEMHRMNREIKWDKWESYAASLLQ